VVGLTPARYGAPASRSELTSMLSGRCEADVWQLIENRAGASWIPALLEPGASLWSSRVIGSDAAPLRDFAKGGDASLSEWFCSLSG
jgi:hypothetical protein